MQFSAKSRTQTTGGRARNTNRRGERPRRREANQFARTERGPAKEPHDQDIPLMERELHQVVGSREWGLYKHNKGIMEGRSTTLTLENDKNTMNVFPSSQKRIQENAYTKLITNIKNWTSVNGWVQETEGENENKWTNPKYQDRVFETGRIIDEKTGEVIYYPLSSMHEDPLGLALHHIISADGSTYKIMHNGFTKYGSPKQQRQWNYRTKANKRWEENKRYQAELDNERINAEREKKYGPDRAAEMQRMDKKKNTNAHLNSPKMMNNPSSSQPPSQEVEKSHAPLFTGPTPSEQNL